MVGSIGWPMCQVRLLSMLTDSGIHVEDVVHLSTAYMDTRSTLLRLTDDINDTWVACRFTTTKSRTV